MNSEIDDFEECLCEETKNILRCLTDKSTRIKAALQLRYLKYKLSDYIGNYSTTN